jgi:hypothetical protein
MQSLKQIEFCVSVPKTYCVASLIPLFGVKLTRLNEEEREKMVEKLEEAIKALERLANRVSEKKQGIDNPY